MSSPGLAISARDVCKQYVGGDGSAIHVLVGVDLDVRAGESVAIVGQSGSGKSTLLHVLGGLDRPDRGEVWVGGERLDTGPAQSRGGGRWSRTRPKDGMGEERLARLRSRSVGFVFQFHHLLREFTAVENVMMPQLIAGTSRRAAEERARELLSSVGLDHRGSHKPSQLSGGEQQRVAVARALANRPLALMADEPSGNLDPQTSDRLHDLLFRVCENQGAAMILVTHDLGLAARAGRILRLTDGHLAGVSAVPEEAM
jgi:lipoprotein-releasing system ATP-binding protein